MTRLYETLFNTEEHLVNDNDVKLEIINQMHGHSDFKSKYAYFDLTAYNNLSREDKYRQRLEIRIVGDSGVSGLMRNPDFWITHTHKKKN